MAMTKLSVAIAPLFCIFIVETVVSAIYNADVLVYESTPSGIMAAVAASNDTGLNVILLSTTTHIGGMCTGGIVNGNEYIAKVFVDASYEGDLLAASGVTYTIGREPNAKYNETHNGRTIPKSLNDTGASNNFVVYVNPYDDDGNLLPLVQPYDNEKPGAGDDRLQSMNYRLCVTRNQSNRVPFTKPPSYDPSRWELLRRMYTLLPPKASAMPTCRTESIPNGKFDMNNCGPISTDFINFSNNYINTTYAQRLHIQQQARNYTLEFLWFLCSDASVPSDARNVMNNEWGFCKDEFVDNDHFPPQLYVREGRRMINKDFVFTQNVAEKHAVYNFSAKNVSIGMGSYNFDAHNTQRFVCVNASMCLTKPPQDVSAGCEDMNSCPYAWNEGDTQISPGKYEIPYMVLTPTKDEVNNLLVSVAVSSSHIGYATLRMEPQFMIMGHSVGTAASILVRNGKQNSVHSMDFNLLTETLLNQGQYISLSTIIAKQ
eukprot:58923_1